MATLYNYLLDEMVAYVEANTGQLFGPASQGTNLFVGFIPDDPDTVTTMFEYEGKPPDYVFGASQALPAITKPHLQVMTRDVVYQNSRDQCESVVRLLEQICNQVIIGGTGASTLYYRVMRIHDPFLFHRDAKRRVYFACNMEVERQPS